MPSPRHYLKAIGYITAFFAFGIAINLIGAWIASYNPWIFLIGFCIMFAMFIIHVVAGIVKFLETKP